MAGHRLDEVKLSLRERELIYRDRLFRYHEHGYYSKVYELSFNWPSCRVITKFVIDFLCFEVNPNDLNDINSLRFLSNFSIVGF